MRCQACDVILTAVEDGAKFSGSGVRVGLCGGCRAYLPKELEIQRVDGTKEDDDELDGELYPWDEELEEDPTQWEWEEFDE